MEGGWRGVLRGGGASGAGIEGCSSGYLPVLQVRGGRPRSGARQAPAGAAQEATSSRSPLRQGRAAPPASASSLGGNQDQLQPQQQQQQPPPPPFPSRLKASQGQSPAGAWRASQPGEGAPRSSAAAAALGLCVAAPAAARSPGSSTFYLRAPDAPAFSLRAPDAQGSSRALPSPNVLAARSRRTPKVLFAHRRVGSPPTF